MGCVSGTGNLIHQFVTYRLMLYGMWTWSQQRRTRHRQGHSIISIPLVTAFSLGEAMSKIPNQFSKLLVDKVWVGQSMQVSLWYIRGSLVCPRQCVWRDSLNASTPLQHPRTHVCSCKLLSLHFSQSLIYRWLDVVDIRW